MNREGSMLAWVVKPTRQPSGSPPDEREVRACAVHACEALARRAGVPAATLDNWLWNRGREFGGRPHVTRTVYY